MNSLHMPHITQFQ